MQFNCDRFPNSYVKRDFFGHFIIGTAEIVFERLHIIISETSVLDNFLCKGKHFGGLSRFGIALYDEDQGVDFYSSGKQRS